MSINSMQENILLQNGHVLYTTDSMTWAYAELEGRNKCYCYGNGSDLIEVPYRYDEDFDDQLTLWLPNFITTNKFLKDVAKLELELWD